MTPGFMIPLGSNKSFNFLIRSNLTGLLYLIKSLTFDLPIPCSALKDPSRPVVKSCTKLSMTSRCEAYCSFVFPASGKTLKCKFPSPKCPKQFIRNWPILDNSDLALSMNVEMFERGNEISWLPIPPIYRFASGIFSLSSHKASLSFCDFARTPS